MSSQQNYSERKAEQIAACWTTYCIWRGKPTLVCADRVYMSWVLTPEASAQVETMTDSGALGSHSLNAVVYNYLNYEH